MAAELQALSLGQGRLLKCREQRFDSFHPFLPPGHRCVGTGQAGTGQGARAGSKAGHLAMTSALSIPPAPGLPQALMEIQI